MSVVASTQTVADVRAMIAAAQQGAVRQTTDAFHQAWYDTTHTWGMTYWMGVATLKNPLDLWVYQEIIAGYKPALVIETGTAFGGSSLFLAQMMDLAYGPTGIGRVVTIDLDPPANHKQPEHARITRIVGDSVSSTVLDQVAWHVAQVPANRHVMVVLDSDHSAAHVRQELAQYARFVTRGCFLIVEDTNVNGHPVHPTHGPGPFEAVQDFLATTDAFVPEPFCEKYLLSMQPGGWLRRVA